MILFTLVLVMSVEFEFTDSIPWKEAVNENGKYVTLSLFNMLDKQLNEYFVLIFVVGNG